MVLYATRPKTLSPADPCNKVSRGRTGTSDNSSREVLHPQISRPLSRVFALASDIRPERVIAADLLYAERGAGGVHLVAEALHPIRVQRASSR